ncbi:MAG: beta-propeller domain-containing protein [Verrucomicrobiales bacterium]
MKTLIYLTGLFLAIFAAPETLHNLEASEPAGPRIVQVEPNRGMLAIHVEVPEGLRKVTLQSRSRAEGSAWVPRAVNRLDGTGGMTFFTLSKTNQFEMLRVQADASDPLPASFYQGTNDFHGNAMGGTTGATGVGSTAGGTTGGAPVNENAADKGREVAESDIWKIEGNYIYFYNLYRGLQLIDASNPDAPVIKSQFSAAGSGEQMYVDNGIVILLTQQNCNDYSSTSTSSVLVLNTVGAEIETLASLPVPGTIVESRKVGSALYVVSQNYQSNTNGTWEYGTTVSSFDLAAPSAPISQGTIWLPGHGSVAQATDRFLFVAQNNYWGGNQNSLHIIDISSPTAEMREVSKVPIAGHIADKFKIHQNEDHLFVVSQAYDSQTRWLTVLESFSLVNPASPQKLARLELAQGEQLHATRFDGDRAYIVTFLRIDPLWVIDLSDPANPEIAGELEVPGWSTYIEPMGDRLISIGVDPTNGWRVAVSLFDVENPAQPTLVDKEFLGEGYSWSEANYDEKAFNVIRDEGLILVPYNGATTNGYSQNVQLIDFDRNTLTRRGEINHSFQPRRADVLQDRILSISGRELISVNAANRDQPIVTAKLQLSSMISKVYPAGEFLVTWGANHYYWNGSAHEPVVLNVSRKDDPDQMIGHLTLPRNVPIIGSDIKGSFLYLLQPNLSYATMEAEATNPPPATLTVVDLSDLPNLTVKSTTPVPETLSPYSTAQPLWPNEGTLVFHLSESYWYGYMHGIPGRGNIMSDALWYPHGGQSGGSFLAFDVANPADTTFASSLIQTNAWGWSNGKAVALNNLIYTSHNQYVEVDVVVADNSTDTKEIITKQGRHKHFLDVIDYSDPKEPVRRFPVSIPNPLESVSHDGALVYNFGMHYNVQGWYNGYTNWIDALAYDGVTAHLVDSFALDQNYYRPYKVTTGGDLFMALPKTTNSSPQLVLIRINDQGKFSEVTRTELAGEANSIGQVGDVLLVSSNNLITPYEKVTTPESALIRPLNEGTRVGCIWPDINQAEGSESDGIWLPLNDFGLIEVSTK